MIRSLTLFSLVLLCSCSTPANTLAMTRQEYNDVILGTPITKLVSELGEPYSVRDLGDRVEEYEYVERIAMNNELVYETHYIFTVVNGQVIDKRLREESRPAYDLMYQEDPNYPSYP